MLLGNEEMLAKVDVCSLTRIGSGSAPLQPAMVRGWQERHGISVINFFGSNEGIGLLSSLEDFPDPDDRAQFFPRYGAPGVTLVLPGLRVDRHPARRHRDRRGRRGARPAGRAVHQRAELFAGYLHGERAAQPVRRRRLPADR